MEEIIDQAILNEDRPTKQIDLDGAGGKLTTGILSIIFMGVIGLILALVTISGENKEIEKYKANPGKYTTSSYNKINAGRTCAYVSLSIMGLLILIVVGVMASN